MRTFDVPGTVVYHDVARAPHVESPAARLHRLAAKAVIEGIQIVRDSRRDRLYATSSRGAGTRYVLDIGLGQCSCQGWQPGRPCKHLALALAELGRLPALDAVARSA